MDKFCFGVRRPKLAFGTKALILSTVTGILVFIFDNAKAFDCKCVCETITLSAHAFY